MNIRVHRFRSLVPIAAVLLAAVLVVLPPSRPATGQEPPKPKVKPAKDREDHPGEAASFRAYMASGGPEVKANAPAMVMADDATVGPAAEPPLVPRAVSADALPKAIQKVRELRGEVATRLNVAPAVLQRTAAEGKPARVGGMPVGPLAAREVTLPGGGKAYRTMSKPLAAAATIDPSGWKWVGPGNIGGRTRSILVHPTEPDVMWLGGISGGVWKTTDAGASWAPLYDFMANMSVSCLALDPTNPDVLYAGTGEGVRGDVTTAEGVGYALRGAGIFVSKDGGEKWEQLEKTKGDDYRYVNRISVAKVGDKTVMLVATETGVFRTEDGGATFDKVAGKATPLRTLDVRFDPNDPLKAVGAGSRVEGGARVHRAIRSTDGGKTWTLAGGLPGGGRIELAYAANNPAVVYASVDESGGAVYRSTDGGGNYTFASNPGHLGGQGFYANCIWAGDPEDPNLVVVGGLDLYRSKNAGQSFTKISVWWMEPDSPHADHHAIVSHANYNGTTNKTVFFGNDGGIYRASDVTTALTTEPTQTTAGSSVGWKALNNGLGITQFYGIAVNTSNGNIAGGTQDNGTLLRKPSGDSESFTAIFGGDGGEMDVDSVNDIYYGEYVGLQLHRSKGGENSRNIWRNIGDITVLPGGRVKSNALFIAPFTLDPSNPKVLYAGGARLWRTTDATAGTPSNDPSETVNPPQFTPLSGVVGDAAGNTAHISAIGVAPSDSKAVWIGFDQGSVYRSADAGPSPGTWKAQTGLPRRYVSRVSVDPADKKTVYVTFTGFEKDNLYKTTDDGAMWAKVGEGKLPEVPFYDLTRHPDNAKLLYLATEVGVFASDDAGATWSPTNQGPTNAPTTRLVWNKKELVAGTHGRGIFTIDLTGAAPSPGGGPAVPVVAPHKAKAPLPDRKVAPPSNDPP